MLFEALLCLFSLVFILDYILKPPRGAPPTTAGVPVLGCLPFFARNPIRYLGEAMKKHGPIFTLQMGTRRMTFLTDPDDGFELFFSDSDAISFQEAVQPFTEKVLGIPSESFRKHHHELLHITKTSMMPTTLGGHISDLVTAFKKSFTEEWGPSGKVELFTTIRKTIFWASVECLFGSEVLKHKSVLSDLIVLDEDFELASSFPQLFLRRFTVAKGNLLSFFKQYIAKDQVHGRLLELLLSKYPDRDALPNIGLATLWASQTNAIFASFWTVVYLIAHPRCLALVRNEYTEHSTGDRPYVKQCTREAIRLVSMGIMVRKATKAIPYRNYVIPAGDMLCISPYWAHRNQEIFDNPEEYRPERFGAEQAQDKKFRYAYMPFGAGVYKCPGQHFAYIEMDCFVSEFLHAYNVKPAGSCDFDSETSCDFIPPVNEMGLVGLRKPVHDVVVEYKRRT